MAGSIGRGRPVQLLVDLLLPAVGRQALVEVALRIHEADADQRHAEVARFLAVIAGQHAEAAGVDRQRLVQRELGGEVGDRLALSSGHWLSHQVCAARARRAARMTGRSWRATSDRPSRAPACRASGPAASAPGCARSAATRGSRDGGTRCAPPASSSTTDRGQRVEAVDTFG